MEPIHAHPVTILGNLWRVLYLTIIPVIRGFAYALQGGLSSWVRTAWIDILIFFLMIFVAVWRWYRVTYVFDKDVLRISSGVLRTKVTRISWERINTLSVYHGFFLRIFRAVRLRADTLGGSFKNEDFSILLSPHHAEDLMKMLREPPHKNKDHVYSPQILSILSLSLLTSNSFAGIVFVATFISQSGRLLGREFSDMIIGTMEELARMLAFGIPPAAAVLAYALLVGWLAGFYMTFIRYKNMLVSYRGRTIYITGGIFSHREYCLDYNQVHFLDIRQSLLTKAMRLYSLYISVVGYGKQKDDINCIIPTEREADFERARTRLFPAYHPAPRQHKPPKYGFMRFLAMPLWPTLGLPLAMAAFIYLFPSWNTFILFVGLMLMVPTLFFLIVNWIDFLTGGLAEQDGFYTLRYSRGFSLHTVVIPKEAVVEVEMLQGPFQRFGKNCDLHVYTRAEGRIRHRCRNLNRADMERLFSMEKF